MSGENTQPEPRRFSATLSIAHLEKLLRGERVSVSGVGVVIDIAIADVGCEWVPFVVGAYVGEMYARNSPNPKVASVKAEN